MPPAASAWLPLFTPNVSTVTKNTSFLRTSRKLNTNYKNNSVTCKASMIVDFDLYDLLGIDSSSDQSQIKTAYRMLQKRCHPDIAGPAGHDMAIILNEAYSVLSDPSSRLAYDKEQAKTAGLKGFTGKPIYSAWFGSETEQRAVFVDEVKCVGCLKCALFAGKTFAIESAYGRARVVAQWADPEHKILEAIEICPVDCISMVDRSDLAALEYLMEKQPRGTVKVGAGNPVGGRVSNIFVDVKKFQTQYQDAMNRAAGKHTDTNWEARISAIQAIRSISNWLYWQSPNVGSNQNLTRSKKRSKEPNVQKLLEAAAARKQARQSNKSIPSNRMYPDEYWVPSTHVIPASNQSSQNSKAVSESPRNKRWKKANNKNYKAREENRRSPIALGIPIVTAAIAAAIVRLQVVQGVSDGLNEHIGGSLALVVVNSSWLQVMLAGITWYFIGAVVVDMIEVIGNRQD